MQATGRRPVAIGGHNEDWALSSVQWETVGECKRESGINQL